MNRPSTLFDQPPAAEAAIEPHSAFLVRAASAREAGDDRGAELALGAYLTLRAVDRAAALGADAPADLREGFHFQAQAALKFVDRLPRIGEVEANHLEGIARALTELDGKGERRLRINLLAYSWHLEQAGQVEEAVDALATSEPFYRSAGHDELMNLGMTAGRFHRTLAHWELADRGYALGYDSAEARQDVRGMLLARLGRAKVLLGRGNLPEARRQMEGIIAEAEGKELAEVRAWAYADLAVTFEKQGLLWEGLRANYEAFRYFRDSQDRARVLSSLGVALRSVGALIAAKNAFESVLRSTTNWYLAANAKVELIAVAVDLNDEMMFHRFWRAAGEHVDLMAPSLGVDYRFKVASGLMSFGRQKPAAKWFADARLLAEQHGLNEWYFRILDAESKHSAEQDPLTAPSIIGNEATVDEIEKGLREYAEALVSQP